MLPVDIRQLENRKGELLKLKKKETADCQLWHNVARTEEQRNSQLSDMAQRGQERRAKQTEEQRNRRLSAMVQHARERHLNVIEGQNHHQIQTFYAARTVLYPIVEEHNCGEMDNLCLKCLGLFFRDEKNTRGIYIHCCHNGNIIEQVSVYPVEMKGLVDGSEELSVHFKNNIRSYNSAQKSFASMGIQIVPSTGRGAYCFRIHGQIYHRTSHLHPAEAGSEKFAQLYVLDSDLATCRRMGCRENSECNPKFMRKIDEIIRRVNPFADAYKMMWELEQQVLREEGHEASENVSMCNFISASTEGDIMLQKQMRLQWCLEALVASHRITGISAFIQDNVN
ncbi:hypothetical protein AVEN_200355-1 [Araneus ventricosus]|uniref:STPR domain-containing protein n=1 Tax=Araneus ventricosus TaxID=182803 RepID=A0A4Y2TPK5_ARAVE|nr:hypothetical protein AVEN_200355-1 [Araneus ventricosus]